MSAEVNPQEFAGPIELIFGRLHRCFQASGDFFYRELLLVAEQKKRFTTFRQQVRGGLQHLVDLVAGQLLTGDIGGLFGSIAQVNQVAMVGSRPWTEKSSRNIARWFHGLYSSRSGLRVEDMKFPG